MPGTFLRIEDYALGAAEKARSPRMRIGFIGSGSISAKMAVRLVQAGHELTIYEPGAQDAAAFTSIGVRVAQSIRDACRWSDAVFTMLCSDELVESVVLGRGGVIDSLSREAIHIGSSSVTIDCADKLVEAHWNACKRYVSAPVAARPTLDDEDHLSVIAAGREEALFRIRPLLDTIGEVTAQLSAWPTDANLLQLSAECLGALAASSNNKPAWTAAALAQFART
jgi:3-hydroxyisobutyrate dehydrogenase-like beta-hydroxyacid dehydrogenase